MPIISRSNTLLVERRMNKAVLLRDQVEERLQHNVGHPLTLDELEAEVVSGRGLTVVTR